MFRGLAIGILISAPMGPIGMLCIQRTLNKGRWPAFFTGLGAAFSDLLFICSAEILPDSYRPLQIVQIRIGRILVVVFCLHFLIR